MLSPMLLKVSPTESHQLRRTRDKTASDSDGPRGLALTTTMVIASRSIRLKILRRPILKTCSILQLEYPM